MPARRPAGGPERVRVSIGLQSYGMPRRIRAEIECLNPIRRNPAEAHAIRQREMGQIELIVHGVRSTMRRALTSAVNAAVSVL